MNILLMFPTVADLNEASILLEDYHTKFCWGHATIEVCSVQSDDKYLLNLVHSYKARYSIKD